ncbi:flavodoxin family protein [Tissierella creatinophila]|uniref:Iron-sulfur flavoprotein n=1 Tax=Tissierella creatinophila DSM 6911 TaxID=1123403 RepID=A0A1U7M3X9_TISCR|nr:flavodoxin family protein [Tissierella creatinophila]OLS02022.1 iron-sulfur flavoprotein [Tissierella creatinophila DSM 6911]
MKNVVALMGSPRKNKNTNEALNQVLDNMNKKEYKIKKIYLGDLKINPCTGCDYCGHKVNCVQKDDMDILYEEFDNADVVILASPLYFNSFNGLTKNIIDRCQRYWSLKYSHGQDYMRNKDRKGICICVGGAPFTFNQFIGINPILDYFFKSINVEQIGNYFISNTDKEPVETQEPLKNELEMIGKNFSTLKKFNIQR